MQEEITRQLAKRPTSAAWSTGSWPARTRSATQASAFLGKAFGAAIFLIFAVLLAAVQQAVQRRAVLFAIILSTIGVFLGLMIMGQAFGIVMSGIGIIALAGIVTNNNIVLIDTYDRLRREGVPVEEAILRTCRERARPVLLTAGAAILGVLPIAFGLNVDFLHARDDLSARRRRSGGSSFRRRSSSASASRPS